jgi:diguanylate cyclase (GGDEF)-like protein/PAS domain S-box-containing protein
MNIDKFDQKISGLRKRVTDLLQSNDDNCQQHLLSEAFKELHSALEDLEMALEELRQQNEELEAAQTTVEAERQRYQDLFEFAPDGYLVTDANGRIQAANRAAASLLNAKQQFLVGKPLVAFIPESDRQLFRTSLNELPQMDWVRPLEVRLHPLKSGSFDAALTVAAIRDGEGNLVALRWLLRDITEGKRAELALRESEERYALAARGANDGLWDWNLKTNSIYFSTRWKSMLGLVENDIGDSVAEWFNRVHPQDIEQLKAVLFAHLKGLTPHFENEHRMLHKDGQYRWMLSRGIAVQDSEQKPYRIAGSQTDITPSKRTEAQLLHDALHDPLTGLPNRVLFMDRLSHVLLRARRHENYLFAVLFLDLDCFKAINDSLGHMRGDQLLIAIARRLEACLRHGDTVARLGGDEFTILLENIQDVKDATHIAERIKEELGLPFNLDGHQVVTTASIGIALSTIGYDRPEDLLRDADTTMYRAKAQGKTARFEVYDRTMHAHLGNGAIAVEK